ncbi:hypothetical protein AXF42_Ash012077 [Apostasia shenzhenica]|uniref:Uncharacterized protein n=1 Tax=Apostasia shenzhenica TaxID=1088818 RepID=A0A2I0AJT2_9ASPA|nr:hypothetical protein AXF42_Ash012077 [Apostasia shenzhenica]
MRCKHHSRRKKTQLLSIMSRRSSRLFFLAVFIIAVAIASGVRSGAALRPFPEEPSGGLGGSALRLNVYEKARVVMASWMARMPTGQSPGGAGH